MGSISTNKLIIQWNLLHLVRELFFRIIFNSDTQDAPLTQKKCYVFVSKHWNLYVCYSSLPPTFTSNWEFVGNLNWKGREYCKYERIADLVIIEICPSSILSKIYLSGQRDERPSATLFNWLKRNSFHNCRRKWSGYDETEGKRAVWSFFTKRKCQKIFQ